MESPAPGARRISTFHARRGRMSDEQRAEVADLLARFGIPGSGRLDLAALFGARPVVLEIGFGMGEATLTMAAADPSTALLVVDVHTPGVLRVLRAVRDTPLPHVRVAHEDAVELLANRLPAGSLTGVRVFFPDPWPKGRHHKRRLVSPSVVHLMALALRPGGFVHLATDWQPYADSMLEVISAEPLLANRYDGFAPRPADRPITRFERQGLDKEHRVRDIVLTRVESLSPPRAASPG